MKINTSYETVTEALNDLSKKGYTSDFSLHTENDCLICKQTTRKLSPEDFEIDQIFRFEGDTDHGDEMIIFAISAARFNIKGVVVNAFGVYADSTTSKIVEKLVKHRIDR